MKPKLLMAFCLFLMIITSCTAEVKTTVLQTNWGTVDDKPVYLYSLRNKNGVKVNITNYGGIITELYAPDREGNFDNIVLGLDSLDAYLQGHPAFGSLVGRYINRIGGAKFTLDGVEYQLAKNSNRRHNIHGGVKNFYTKVWTPSTACDDHSATLTLTYLSPDGEEGFPGNLQVRVDYILTDDNELRIEYTATTDKPTVVNLSNHTYFNLTGAEESVHGHEVRIDADEFIPTDRDGIPTGEVLPVDGTPVDLRQWTRLGERMDSLPGGFDHSLCVKGRSGAEPVLVAEVREPKSGRTLKTYTTQPGLCFYTGRWLGTKRNTTHGRTYEPFWGLCLETQHHPDSPNHPNFPSTVLRPGETYREVTVYQMGSF